MNEENQIHVPEITEKVIPVPEQNTEPVPVPVAG